MSFSSTERLDFIRQRFPATGLFQDKEWKLSPTPFALTPETLTLMGKLGPALRSFQRACNDLYFASAEAPDGHLGWVAGLLDLGKPPAIVALGRRPEWRSHLPAVIRPDLILTDDGVILSEIDSLPGGMGLTGWLNETYAQLGERVVGGADGMVEGFAAAFPEENVLISRESADYAPEMQWLAERLGRSVHRTWEMGKVQPGSYYRFFELFDIPNVERAELWLEAAKSGDVRFTPPVKAFLEEKLWLALFWSPQLATWWSDHLSSHDLSILQRCIPRGWVFDPQRLPYWAIYPDIGVNDWRELKSFSQKQRQLVLKVSGFSELGWGARGVVIGHDLSQAQWAEAVDEALHAFPKSPHILQRFHKGRLVQQPVEGGMMKGRVRLCPYFLVPRGSDDVKLNGVLATVCPADKKILHGMTDAVMVPCI